MTELMAASGTAPKRPAGSRRHGARPSCGNAEPSCGDGQRVREEEQDAEKDQPGIDHLLAAALLATAPMVSIVTTVQIR